MFVILYESCVMCHVSRVTCNLSHTKKLQSGRLRVCYQRGLPRLVSLYITFKGGITAGEPIPWNMGGLVNATVVCIPQPALQLW